MQRTTRLFTGVSGPIIALLAALSMVVVVQPASATTVLTRTEFKNSFLSAWSSVTSADGCILTDTTIDAGLETFGPIVSYNRSVKDVCTETSEFEFGFTDQPNTLTFDSKNQTARLIASLPLSTYDENYNPVLTGEVVAIDLSVAAIGKPTKVSSKSTVKEPGGITRRYTSKGTQSQAAVSGTPAFQHATISFYGGATLELLKS